MADKKIVRRRNSGPIAVTGCLESNHLLTPLQPFLKWPGGKRWLVEGYRHLFPRRIDGRYIEPFLGGGAVFFHLQPSSAILTDINADLICAYRTICEAPRQVIDDLWFHHYAHQMEPDTHYYKIRDTQPEGPRDRASRFIYLNRTCFNGIYRVNKQGKFNVPRGSKLNVVYPDDNWLCWSRSLQRADIYQSDFQSTIDLAEEGDFLFIDPPYTVHHNLNGFVKYNEVMFSWSDQQRLAQTLERARRRGAAIMMTNANHKYVRDLYGPEFQRSIAKRYCSVSANNIGRRYFEELVITTY